MLSDDLRIALKSQNIILEEASYAVMLKYAVAKAIPRIESMEQLLKEWMTADPPDKYDDRVVRTLKALEVKG